MTVTHQPALSALLTHGNTQAFPKGVRTVPALPLPTRNAFRKNISFSAFIPTVNDGDFPPTELKSDFKWLKKTLTQTDMLHTAIVQTSA
jgi:hypothetical protein